MVYVCVAQLISTCVRSVRTRLLARTRTSCLVKNEASLSSAGSASYKHKHAPSEVLAAAATELQWLPDCTVGKVPPVATLRSLRVCTASNVEAVLSSRSSSSSPRSVSPKLRGAASGFVCAVAVEGQYHLTAAACDTRGAAPAPAAVAATAARLWSSQPLRWLLDVNGTKATAVGERRGASRTGSKRRVQ
jgi:hypothetical protein